MLPGGDAETQLQPLGIDRQRYYPYVGKTRFVFFQTDFDRSLQISRGFGPMGNEFVRGRQAKVHLGLGRAYSGIEDTFQIARDRSQLHGAIGTNGPLGDTRWLGEPLQKGEHLHGSGHPQTGGEVSSHDHTTPPPAKNAREGVMGQDHQTPKGLLKSWSVVLLPGKVHSIVW